MSSTSHSETIKTPLKLFMELSFYPKSHSNSHDPIRSPTNNLLHSSKPLLLHLPNQLQSNSNPNQLPHARSQHHIRLPKPPILLLDPTSRIRPELLVLEQQLDLRRGGGEQPLDRPRREEAEEDDLEQRIGPEVEDEEAEAPRRAVVAGPSPQERQP